MEEQIIMKKQITIQTEKEEIINFLSNFFIVKETEDDKSEDDKSKDCKSQD